MSPEHQSFDYKLGYRMGNKYPDRAFFSNDSAPRQDIFRNLHIGIRADSWPHAPGWPVRFNDGPVGIFVVQIRGVVGDCALPGLIVWVRRGELSFEWKTLFSRMFSERNLTMTIPNEALVGHLSA